MKQATTRIVLWITAQVIYNLLRKYLSRSIDQKYLLIWLYFFAFLVWGIYFLYNYKSWETWILFDRKRIPVLLITALATNVFQFSSAMIAKSEFSITSYRLITSIGFIAILMFLESWIYGDKITSEKLIGMLFGFISLYFLMK